MSSANDIQGRDCIFQMKIGDTYLDVICAKTFSFNRVYELKETTTVASGFDKEFRPRKKSYTISFNGVVQIVAEADKPTIKTMFDYAESFLPISYRIIYEDVSGNVMVIQGSVYVNGAIFNANPINLLDGTIEMTGDGPITILDAVPEFITLTVSVTGQADAKTRFILYKADGTIAYDTSTLLALLPTSGWLVQGESVVMSVQKGQYAWGVNTVDVGSGTNTFNLDIVPPVAIGFGQADHSQNSLPNVFDFLTDKTATFDIGQDTPPPTCVPPTIPGSPVLPDGQVGQAWATSFAMAGSDPFNITNVTKPSWLSIFLYQPNGVGTTVYVMLQGTPDVAGTGIVVSFDVNNACGTVPFSDTIDIAAAPGTSGTLTYDFSQFDQYGTGTMRIYVNSILIVDATTTASGSINVNENDVIEAQVLGNAGDVTKNLVVVLLPSTPLYSETASTNRIFSWVVAASSNYDVSGYTEELI